MIKNVKTRTAAVVMFQPRKLLLSALNRLFWLHKRGLWDSESVSRTKLRARSFSSDHPINKEGRFALKDALSNSAVSESPLDILPGGAQFRLGEGRAIAPGGVDKILARRCDEPLQEVALCAAD